jgi:tetratricopeptide (TPR) repeat protein
MDSALILADKALSFDSQLSEAYTVRGSYYHQNGQDEQAISEFEKAIQLNPNEWTAYYMLGITYLSNYELVKALINLHKAAALDRGPVLHTILLDISYSYNFAGFLEKAKLYRYEAYLLDGDSISYYNELAVIESLLGDRDKYLKSLESIYLMDTTRNVILRQLGNTYGIEGRFEESLIYLKRYFEKLEDLGRYNIPEMNRLGYAYWMNGFYAEAEYYFDTMIEYYNELSLLGRKSNSENYNLASIYAFRGEKDRAYENLRKFNEMERIPLWWLNLIRIDPLFDSIRDEPEFQQIVRDLEAKYQAVHERVRQWLEENDML